jgi:hypothetical protein
MKNIMTLFAMIVLSIVSTNLSAQSKMTPEEKEELKAKFAAYKEKLNLSEDQSVKVEAINATYFEGLSQLKNSTERKMSKYKKFKALQSTRDQQMKEVLNEEQYKLYKEFQKEMREDLKENRRNK